MRHVVCNKFMLFLLVLKYCNWLTACVRQLGVWQIQKTSDTTGNNKKSVQSSCRLQSVQLEDVVIGWCGEEELLLAGRPVITGTVQPQRPLKVQELTHEVEVWGNVGLLPLDKVISIVERKIESLHQVGHGDRDRATDSGQAVDQDAALFRSSLVCERWRKTTVSRKFSKDRYSSAAQMSLQSSGDSKKYF